MLFQVEALLESLSEAGTAVDLATQAAFKDLRTRTLKQQREAFATQAGTGSAQKKIAWEDVRPRNPVKSSLPHIGRGRHIFCFVQVGFKSSAGNPPGSKPLAAITSGSIDDLFSTAAVVAKKTTSAKPSPADKSTEQGEWIEAFDKNR